MFPPFVHGALIDADPVVATYYNNTAVGATCAAKPDLLRASDTSSKMPVATTAACCVVRALCPPFGPVESEPQPTSAPAKVIQASRLPTVESRRMTTSSSRGGGALRGGTVSLPFSLTRAMARTSGFRSELVPC